MPNWELKNCCRDDQVAFLVTIGVFSVVILALWRTVLMTPFKLITVFLHEVSHAIACKLTCGQVEGIQVHANEGGVTQTRGGIYWLILPAGCNSLLPLKTRLLIRVFADFNKSVASHGYRAGKDKDMLNLLSV